MTKRMSTGCFWLVIVICYLLVPALAGGAEEDSASDARQSPLWEAGVMGSAIRMPAYRGSDSYRTYALPLPYFVYRGDVVRANRTGVRGIFWERGNWESSLSLWGNPPVNDESAARQGMPDLDAIVEAGPALKWYVAGRQQANPFYLQASLRAAASLDISTFASSYQGLHATLSLVYSNYSLLRPLRLGFGINLTLDGADAGLNGYFYDVAPRYANAERKSYRAHGGYAGFSLAVNVRRRLGKELFIALFSRWENASGAVFVDSPLVQRENNLTLGIALSWRLAAAERK